jgi:hypothetical protein
MSVLDSEGSPSSCFKLAWSSRAAVPPHGGGLGDSARRLACRQTPYGTSRLGWAGGLVRDENDD